MTISTRRRLHLAEYQVFYTLSPRLRDRWIKVVNNAYNESHRRYHTLTHIRSMLRQLDVLAEETYFTPQQLQILQLAIWFHDIVYHVPSESGCNEVFSALRFQHFAHELKLVMSHEWASLIVGSGDYKGCTISDTMYPQTYPCTRLPVKSRIWKGRRG